MQDRKNYQYKGCSAVTVGLTAAQRAQKVLASAAIPSSVGKIKASDAHHGCSWCVNFSCNQRENVKTVLSSAGINIKWWEGEYDLS